MPPAVILQITVTAAVVQDRIQKNSCARIGSCSWDASGLEWILQGRWVKTGSSCVRIGSCGAAESKLDPAVSGLDPGGQQWVVLWLPDLLLIYGRQSTAWSVLQFVFTINCLGFDPMLHFGSGPAAGRSSLVWFGGITSSLWPVCKCDVEPRVLMLKPEMVTKKMKE